MVGIGINHKSLKGILLAFWNHMGLLFSLMKSRQFLSSSHPQKQPCAILREKKVPQVRSYPLRNHQEVLGEIQGNFCQPCDLKRKGRHVFPKVVPCCFDQKSNVLYELISSVLQIGTIGNNPGVWNFQINFPLEVFQDGCI